MSARKILMIDDDWDFLDATRIVLDSEGYDVELAATPQEGKDRARDWQPDLVILDVMMPDGYEGFQVARYIREELQRRDLPIVVLSGVMEKKKIPYYFPPTEQPVPIDVFLDKPVNPRTLLNTLRDLLARPAAK
jgi:CheY-like chemotaxis protein